MIPKMPNSYLGTSMFEPKVLFTQAPMFARPSRSRYESSRPPAMTPQMLPIPPRITIERMKIEMLKKKSSGKVPPLKLA
jgi:hypothetical protein